MIPFSAPASPIYLVLVIAGIEVFGILWVIWGVRLVTEPVARDVFARRWMVYGPAFVLGAPVGLLALALHFGGLALAVGHLFDSFGTV